MLVNAGNAERARNGGCKLGDELAFDCNRAAIRRVGARDDFNERAFACAIFAKERVDLAGTKIKIDSAQGAHAAVIFYDLAKGEER